MKKLLFPIFLLLIASMTWADPVKQLMSFVQNLGGSPEITEETDDHVRIRMADSCYYDIHMAQDTIVVIQTACAPICSSCVRVYNKEWEELRQLWPTESGIFLEAAYRDGQVYWTDNTAMYLDEEERQMLKQ